jgi:hypothetical protein
MERNVETSFTNIPRTTNFKKKDEDVLIDAIEPPTSLGFISSDRNADISDLLYIRDALSNERSIEGQKKSKENEELLRFRITSSSRSAASQQYGVINLKKEDSRESSVLSSQIKMKLTKKRKITIDESTSSGSTDNQSSQRTERNTPPNKTSHTSNSDVVVPCNTSALSSLIGFYAGEDSD